MSTPGQVAARRSHGVAFPAAAADHARHRCGTSGPPGSPGSAGLALLRPSGAGTSAARRLYLDAFAPDLASPHLAYRSRALWAGSCHFTPRPRPEAWLCPPRRLPVAAGRPWSAGLEPAPCRGTAQQGFGPLCGRPVPRSIWHGRRSCGPRSAIVDGSSDFFRGPGGRISTRSPAGQPLLLLGYVSRHGRTCRLRKRLSGCLSLRRIVPLPITAMPELPC